MSDQTRRKFAIGCIVAAACLWAVNAGYVPSVGPGIRNVSAATFVLVDHWEDRASNDQFRTLNPNAVEWDQMRANGSKVLNFDAGSPEAAKYAKQTADGVPVLIAFDGDRVIASAKVSSIADVRTQYQKITGKRLGAD